MKKLLFTLFLIPFFYLNNAQEMGFNTTDIGGQFQWYPAGTITGLHLAFNAKLHHSIHFKFGYNKTNRKDWGENDIEKGSAWGGGIGYRYYFKPFPHKFFLGASTDLWRFKINWTEGNQSGITNTWTLQPTFEIGYTFIINDQMFITPSLSNGAEINIKTEGQKVGQGFITLAGIRLGVRF